MFFTIAVCDETLAGAKRRPAQISRCKYKTFAVTGNKFTCVKQTAQIMHKCLLVYKCINKYTPEYLQNYFMKKAHRYNTRCKDDELLPKPKLELFKKSFHYSGPFYFNSPPDYIKNALSLGSFKDKIFKHFFIMKYLWIFRLV